MNDWFRELTRSSANVLEDFLRNGEPPSVVTLVGYEYRGANIGAVPRRLGLQMFIKGFFGWARQYRGLQHPG